VFQIRESQKTSCTDILENNPSSLSAQRLGDRHHDNQQRRGSYRRRIWIITVVTMKLRSGRLKKGAWFAEDQLPLLGAELNSAMAQRPLFGNLG
jgi:hypothetical protein